MSKTPFEQSPLTYQLDELDSYLTKEILDKHYGGYHKKYVDKLNENLNKIDKTINSGDEQKIKELVQVIKHNYGFHINHELFW